MEFDVAIVGSGLAGLSVALNLAQTRRVAVIAKRSITEGASDWAQGGIAAVLDSADSIENHVRDTLVAGAGLCDEAATRFIVENGRAAIEWLIEQGVPFTKDDSAELGFHLTREGGHSHRRIIHAADATGHAVVATLSERVRQHPNITLLEDHYAIDLITSDRLGLPGRRCHGLYALDVQSGRTVTIERRTPCSPPAAPARCICTRQIPTPRRATALQWHGAQAAGCRTWSSSSSTPPASSIRTRSRF